MEVTLSKACFDTGADKYRPITYARQEKRAYADKDGVICELSGSVRVTGVSCGVNHDAFRAMVRKLLEAQGNKAIQGLGISMIDIDPETRAQAQEAISEDGYYGVKQTSERILSFAKAMAGGDPANVQVMRDAVIQGFKEAERIWGGKLPDICQQTYKAVMDDFDAMQGVGANA